MKKSVLFISIFLLLTSYTACSKDNNVATSDNKTTTEVQKNGVEILKEKDSDMLFLEKSKDQEFVVLNLTDIQMSDYEWESEPEKPTQLRKTLHTLINSGKPDLITVSGDISVAAYSNYAYTYFANLIDSFGIPWAVVWGNHDNEGGKEKVQAVVDEFKTYSNFVYNEGPKHLGNGNYLITIHENGNPIHSIFMMDTHDKMDYNGNMEWATLTADQLKWYEKKINLLKSVGCNESSIIAHIPIHEFRTAFNNAKKADLDISSTTFEDSFGEKYWNTGYEDSFGMNYEGICSYPEDFGAFELIKSLGSTKLYLCGHDHMNCSVIRHEGVTLAYSLKTGIGNYYKEGLHGGTILKIDEDGKVDISHKIVK